MYLILKCSVTKFRYRLIFCLHMVHNLKRNTKHCQKGLGENVKCMCSEKWKYVSRAENLRCEVECLVGGRNGERGGGRRLPINAHSHKILHPQLFSRQFFGAVSSCFNISLISYFFNKSV